MDSQYEIISKEVSKITSKGNPYRKPSYKVIIRNEKNNVPVQMFESIEVTSNFANNVTDQIIVNLFLAAGDYNYYVFRYKDNIEATVSKYYDDKLEEIRTYKAILLNANDSDHNINNNASYEKLNEQKIIRATFQLIEPEMEVIRTLKISGVYKNTDLKSLIIAGFNNTISSTKIRNKNIVATINMVKPDNTKMYNHIVIPTGTRLIDLPTFLQDTSYGIYKSDIGVYFRNLRTNKPDKQTLSLFIYPLYTKEPTYKSEIYIYHAPTPVNKMNDRNHIIENNILKIVVGDVEILEVKENLLMDKGSSITSNDPDSLLMYNSKVSNDKIVYNKDNSNNNFTHKTKDGLVNERYVGNEVNLFKHYSSLSSDSLDLLRIKWMFSDHTLLIPGMSVTIFYQLGKGMKKMKGTVIEAISFYTVSGKIEETNLLLKVGEVK